MSKIVAVLAKEANMRFVLIAVILALFAASASAQGRGMQNQQPASQQKQSVSPEERKKQEKDYNDALSRIPNKKPADPWGKMR
jgi:hypothetical protein